MILRLLFVFLLSTSLSACVSDGVMFPDSDETYEHGEGHEHGGMMNDEGESEHENMMQSDDDEEEMESDDKENSHHKKHRSKHDDDEGEEDDD